MRIAFGHNARATGEFKQFSWALQYVFGEESLVIRLTRGSGKFTGSRSTCAVIGMRMAWKYRADRAADVKESRSRFAAIAWSLGMNPHSDADVHAVTDMVQHKLNDLVKMAPMPDELEEKHGKLIECNIGPKGQVEIVIAS